MIIDTVRLTTSKIFTNNIELIKPLKYTYSIIANTWRITNA